MSSSQPQSALPDPQRSQPQPIQSPLPCDATTSALDRDLEIYSRGLDRSRMNSSAAIRPSTSPYDSPASRAAASVALQGSGVNWPTPMSRMGQKLSNFASPKDRRGPEWRERETLRLDDEDEEEEEEEEEDPNFTKTVPMSSL